jgi:hypothetical protein
MSERIYEINGKKLPSVTTILGCLSKPALVPWAAKETAEAFRALVSEAIENDLEIDLDAMVGEAKKAHRKKKTEAADKGTAVHNAIELWLDSGGRMHPEEIADDQARAGLQRFLEWGEQHEIKVLKYEEVITDDQFFAGRYDLLAEVDGTLTLIDFKTSTGIWDEYWLQVAAYASCVSPQPKAVAILRIDKTSGEFEYVDRLDWFPHANAFIKLAEFYNLQKGLKK